MAELKSGMIDKTVSFIMAVPRSSQDIESPDETVANLMKMADADGNMEIKSVDFDEEKECPVIQVNYLGKSYTIHFFVEEFEIPELFRINHRFTEQDINAMESATQGITTAMVFGEDNLESYHLQLKILNGLVPDMAGIVDFSQERIFSPVWAKMAAESAVPPSPDYLYSAQAVGSEGVVWLHTHGLNRCGFVELEILKTNQEDYQNHGNILTAIVKRILGGEEFPKEEEPFFAARLENGGALIITWLDWARAAACYKDDMLGGMNDRQEAHNENTGAVYVYRSKEDFEKHIFVPLAEVEPEFLENPLIMLTNEETKRMSDLARERIGFLRKGLKLPNAEAIVKLGLYVDEDKLEESGSKFEHIWFKVLTLKEKTIVGELTQEPYYIADMHTGSIAEVGLDQLTDWQLYLEETTVTPDSAYQLV